MSCTTPLQRQRRRPHERGSGRFCFFTPTMTNFATSIGPTATKRNKSNLIGSKTTMKPSSSTKTDNAAPEASATKSTMWGRVAWHVDANGVQAEGETAKELLQHRVRHQLNIPELGRNRHRHRQHHKTPTASSQREHVRQRTTRLAWPRLSAQ